jgi:hypothetical protein
MLPRDARNPVQYDWPPPFDLAHEEVIWRGLIS